MMRMWFLKKLIIIVIIILLIIEAETEAGLVSDEGAFFSF